MESLFLATAPPLDPAWLVYEYCLPEKKVYTSPLDRQRDYAIECRARNTAAISNADSPYGHLASVISQNLTVPSSVDSFQIPIIEYFASSYDRVSDAPVVVYIHGGGLYVGEADSEELSCRLIAETLTTCVYSVGYRLMPLHPAQTCVSDVVDALKHLAAEYIGGAKILLLGSSSGGQLAALAAQQLPSLIEGVLLRCPVTSSAFDGVDQFVPTALQHLHTSATHPSFLNSLLGRMDRDVPRDGLQCMPLEASAEVLRHHPRTWIQMCTNDGLYSDGVCYARALEEAGVEIKVDVVRGWPHTFWLKAPLLPRAVEADRAMLEGLAWLARSGEAKYS